MRGCGRSHIPAADFAWSLDLLVDDLFAVADAAGLQQFPSRGRIDRRHGGACRGAGAAERIATLTVSNGAHLGASIQRVEAWQRQLDEGGVKAWSDAFMPDRFHDDALSPERLAWFATQQEKWPRESILNALRRADWHRSRRSRLKDIRCPTLLLHPDGSPFIPVPVMAELHRLLPGSELNVIGHSRHGLPYSHAEQCAALLRTFLDSHTAG